MSRWPTLTRLALLLGIMFTATWSGMAYASGHMVVYGVFCLIASILATIIHLSPPPKPSKE